MPRTELMKRILKHVKFNLRKDKPDNRDFIYYKIFKEDMLPDEYDLRGRFSPIENQLKFGACGPNAAVSILEFLQLKETHEYKDLSRMFVYYNTRNIMGTVTKDSGVTNRDMMKAIAKHGACLESNWEYKEENFLEMPLSECYKEGQQYKISEYWRIEGNTYNKLDLAICSCICEGYPVIFGLKLYSSFMSDKVKETGEVPNPKFFEKVLGWHDMLIVGYNPTHYIVRNTWGKEWGNLGCCLIPKKYVLTNSMDLWTIRK